MGETIYIATSVAYGWSEWPQLPPSTRVGAPSRTKFLGVESGEPMGIRFLCPNGHKLNVKSFLAGKKAFCPVCGVRLTVPLESTIGSSKDATPSEQPVVAVPFAPSPTTQPPAAPISMTAMAAAAAATGPVVPTPAPTMPAPAPTVPVTPATAPIIPPTPVIVSQPPAPPAPPSGPPDPLAEAGDVVWYVRPPSGGQYGPATGTVMHDWINEGRISADSLVWREGWRDWQEAGEVFPQLLQSVADPAAPQPISAPAPPAPRMPPRRRSSTTQAIVIALLVLAVIVLAVIFAWVVMRPVPTPDSGEPAAKPTAMIWRANCPLTSDGKA
jgi:hypothetical protein